MTTTVLVPHEQGVAALSGLPGVWSLRYDPDAVLPPGAQRAEVLVAPLFGGARPELVGSLPRLRLVQLLTAGYESWSGQVPDGVVLSTARGAHGGSTAEWVLAVLLALHRDLPRFVRAQDACHWDHHPTSTLLGSRVLVLGAGDVARQIARRLEPFEVTATLVGRRARDGVRGLDELPDLLGGHDAVVLALPHTRATTGLVDAAFLARMPDGAVLVNAARGPVVRTDALLAELASGRLRAALDVTEPEPLPADHPLWRAPGVLITPHVGGGVDGAMERAFAVAAEQIAAFARGEDPPNLVDQGN
ncbi:MAG: phosphoglycerate dehydrogenase [Pseudonocardiaceae bacterium]|nr:phosphoglycerate dehydrogenase [Pseudonocardiaceae bacterium]